jgi:hypothetical protein
MIAIGGQSVWRWWMIVAHASMNASITCLTVSVICSAALIVDVTCGAFFASRAAVTG